MTFQSLNEIVINPGNCLHCGACVGLLPECLEFEQTPKGPLPRLKKEPGREHKAAMALAWAVCPGRGIPYPELFDAFFSQPENRLTGPLNGTFLAHAADPEIRERGASGGVITRTLIHLLETGRIDGAVVTRQGIPTPEDASPMIATTRDQILEAAQSIYQVTPVLTVLPLMASFEGRLALVGLPEQVAALRMLQTAENQAALKVKYVLGPYTGTNMYKGAVRAFLRGHGVPDSVPITGLKWRAGKWPGYLEVRTPGGGVYRAEKFYYNYLIPFFVSRNCLIIPDFMNELTDISVGDAWRPDLEKKGGGHSVTVARSEKGLALLKDMEGENLLSLQEIDTARALSMHGHMLDFKKRGSFIRLGWQARMGKPVPDFGYRPARIALGRRATELIVSLAFALGRVPGARDLVSRLPIKMVGSCFDFMRRSWKAASKPTKRKGLAEVEFSVHQSPERWREIVGHRD